ncbi:MAG: hypothetical protein BZ138_08435 [Methanosphaera sp. rholeuAM270]|nr:MAG: hypothetical protein BZ138_08435 [Methanosphaera sp. rholeuAM270]
MSRPGTFETFDCEENQETGGWRVVWWLRVYAPSFGDDAYPEQLSEYRGSGKTTFKLLARTAGGRVLEGLGHAEAMERVREMTRLYEGAVVECEDGADWDSMPEALPFTAEDVLEVS